MTRLTYLYSQGTCTCSSVGRAPDYKDSGGLCTIKPITISTFDFYFFILTGKLYSIYDRHAIAYMYGK